VKGTFLWRNRVLLSSAGLIILSLHMISAGLNRGPIAAPVAALLELIGPVEGAIAGVGDGAHALVHNYIDLVHVRADNLKLRAQLARASSDRARVAELEAENHHLSQLLELRDALGLNAVGATVIGSDATGLSRTLILSEGTSSGLRAGMAVVSNQGVVGKLIETSGHASRVLLIDDHNSALDGFDQRSRARGIVAGVVDDGLIMKYVDRSEDVRVGDAVVTSGLGGIFPRGLLVGTIKSVNREAPGMFISVAVAAAVNFRSLEQVLVITEQPPHLGDDRKG
jgi:rod shape-determining protein MreC